ncbi:MAG: hypothetical protein K2P79_06990 [Sphingomonas sp.]|nr:hypothetical protein [Sphingomonas sp.]
MDLEFRRFEQDVGPVGLPIELAVVMVGAAARQATSQTARTEAQIEQSRRTDRLNAFRTGAFNTAMAAALITWKEE